MARRKLWIVIPASLLIVLLIVGAWAFSHWLGFMLHKPKAADVLYDWPMTVVAGDGEPGFVDGGVPRFNKPIRLAPYGSDSVLVADINNHALRVVHLDGRTETLAGGPAKQGYLDGPAEQARFDSPHGVAVRDDGVIAVAEAANNTIRLLTPTSDKGMQATTRYYVTTLAGTAGESGLRDGATDKSLFSAPHSVVWGEGGALYVADIGNARVRKIENGVVTTVAGTGSFGDKDGPLGEGTLQYPMDLAIDSNGDILIADAGTGLIRRYSPESGLATVNAGVVLDMPHGLDVTPEGSVVVAEMYAHRIVLLDRNGKIVRLLGAGEPGNGHGQLYRPAAVLIHAGHLWIADLKNHRVVVTEWQQQ